MRNATASMRSARPFPVLTVRSTAMETDESWEAPDWCVPIRANVLSFEWEVRGLWP